LFFAITPPPATVERAWQRGLTTARYKAVDDLLYHNIEAFTGIPELFFHGFRSPIKTFILNFWIMMFRLANYQKQLLLAAMVQ
jgi:hypothetical protein